MNTQSLKAVTFDLWETLLFERDGANAYRTAARCRNLAQTLNKLGVDTSIEQVTSALDRTIDSLLKVWDQNKDLTHIEQLQFIVKHTSNGIAKIEKEWLQQLSHAYVSPLHEIPPYLNPDTLQVFQWLKEQKKKIGLICNTGMTPGFELRKFLSQSAVSEYFDTMIFSDEVGIRKPDPEIFHLAAHKLRVRPREAVHIGDNLKSDVWGAKNAGFRAIYLSGTEGHDKIAEKDSKSLVILSRSLGNLQGEQMAPDKTISTLAMATKAIRELENHAA
jgi:putative hydrolase of the HAD superfamily